MRRLTAWLSCCTALALLAHLLPVAAAPGAMPAATGAVAPCHAASDAPHAHDQACAHGCDTSPSPHSASLDWAPAPARAGDSGSGDPVALPPAMDPEPPRGARASASTVPRAPPALRAASPVTRHDILLD